MIDKLLDRLVGHYEKKCKKKLGGIPLLWLIYQTDKEPPNIIFNLHPDIKHDLYLNKQFTEIADYIRENYKDEFMK